MRRAAFAIAIAACASPRAPKNGGDAWSYVVTPPASGDRVLVEATFGETDWLVIGEDVADAVRDVAQKIGEAWQPAPRHASAWELTQCGAPCTVRYAVDLRALTDACGRGCAMRVDDAVVAPLSSWLLRPHGDAAIALRTRGDAPFAFGMRRKDGAYTFRASELREASYTAFGPMRKRSLDRSDARVDVAIVGAKLAMSDDDCAKWMSDATGVLAKFYGRFPVDATLFVLPVGGDEVRFGSVMALTGASIALFVGRDMPNAAVHDDWVVVHELFHLGTPTFEGEGRWLGEGLATYYEPLLRARAGWMTEEQLWRHFESEMPRGVRPEGSAPDIEDRRDIDSMYWGGALFAMIADARIREATVGKKSLDDALRAAHARGAEVTRVWRLRDFIRVGDEATGTRVLGEMHEAFTRGDAIDLPKEMARAKRLIPAK